ncbi:MAG TPA: Ig-like domain-containing protein [Gemmatimonadaceae bacterium]|nr:Ig-like domain-containing protein [Gemmatimonadaceae bacterium]
MAPLATLSISPQPVGDTVAGKFTFNTALTDLPTAASVEYLLDGRSLSGAIYAAAPFAFAWNSAETWDGPAAFRAVVRDAAGAAIAESAPLSYTVDNDRGRIVVTSPDLGQPLSGTVNITVKARRPDARVSYREANPVDYASVDFRFRVDGKIHPPPGRAPTDPPNSIAPVESADHGWASQSYVLDTTRLANGRHELTFTAAALDETYVTHLYTQDAAGKPGVLNIPNPASGVTVPTGTTALAAFGITTDYAHPLLSSMVQFTVTVDNGAALREIRPRWRDVHLALSGGQTSATVPVRSVYADGTEQTLTTGVTYATSDAAVATVSSAGVVTAVAPGEATLTVTALGREAKARVHVRAVRNFPHFTRDGEIRTTLDYGRSVFVRSLFFIDPREFEGREAALGAQLHSAGVNTISSGFIFPPYPPQSLADWKSWWDQNQWGVLKGIADRQNLYLLLTGDSMARLRSELRNSVTYATAGDAIEYAFQQLKASGRVIAVDMIDEANMLWGPTPTPAADWPANGPDDPAIPADAFVTLMGILNRVANRTPVAFPVLGVSVAEVAANWMGNPAFSDYASIYFVGPAGDDGQGYPFGTSLPQEAVGRTQSLDKWRPVLQRDRPMLLIHSVTGPAYAKRVVGTQYQPNRDFLFGAGSRPIAAAAGVLYAVAEGMAGVRVYGFDSIGEKQNRSGTNPWGGGLQQTFADPFETGTDRWQALGSAFALVQRREKQALQPQSHAPHLGDGIITGVRSGPDGTMLIAVNFTERTETARVDLTPYLTSGTICQRYEVLGASLGSRILSSSTTTDVVELAPGMGMVWLFVGSAVPLPTIRFTRPLSGSRVTGNVSLEVQAESNTWPINRVEILVDGTIVATHTPPANTFSGTFQTTWNSATAPRHGVWLSVTARVYDTNSTMEEARATVLVP